MFSMMSVLAGCNVLIAPDEINHDAPLQETGSTDADVDADADSDTDTDTDTAVVYSDVCPDPGMAAVVAQIVSVAGDDLVAADTLSMAMYTTFIPGGTNVPDFAWATTGDQVQGNLPYDLVTTSHGEGSFTALLCLDRGGDDPGTCMGPGDGVAIGDALIEVAADRVTYLSVEVASPFGTLTELASLPVDPACP